MSEIAPVSSASQDRFTLLAAFCLCMAAGLFMLMHALGVVDAAWLNPNPHVPPWVFAVLGVILLCGAWLSLARLRWLPRRLSNAAGWAFVILSAGVANWLVFFAKGSQCRLGLSYGTLGWNGASCSLLLGTAMLLLDVLLLVALATVWSRRRT